MRDKDIKLVSWSSGDSIILSLVSRGDILKHFPSTFEMTHLYISAFLCCTVRYTLKVVFFPSMIPLQ